MDLNGETCYLNGVAAARRGDWESAVEYFGFALNQMPETPGIWNDLCVALMRSGRLEKGMATFRRALNKWPQDPMLLSNLAASLTQVKEMTEGGVWAEFAVAAASDPILCVHAADVLTTAGRFSSAAMALQKAIDLGGGSAAVWANLASALYACGRTKDGHSAQLTALALAPANRQVQSNLLYSLNLHDDFSPEAIAGIHFDWGKAVAARAAAEFDFSGKSRDTERPLRVGILTADLRTHSVGYFASPIIRSTSGYEVSVFSTVREPDAATVVFKSTVENWVNLSGIEEEQCAKTIYDAEIDVLIEMGGHTSPGNLQILARKPAPVQVAYLAYPTTTGLPAVDYLITDRVSDPPGRSEHLYSERLIWLEPCMLCYQPPALRTPIVKSEKVRPFRFGSFAQRQKLSGRVLDLWAAILREAKDAELYLKATAWFDPGLQAEILERFRSHGIECRRIKLSLHNASVDDHLRTYNGIDLALDTMPYGGITTTCEALWMGVPVLTLRGQSQVSRTCASILTAIGLSGLIAESAEEYVSLAVRIANGNSPMPERGSDLRARFESSPVMDPIRFRGKWEIAVRGCWREWCRTAGS